MAVRDRDFSTGETALLITFLLVATLMFIESFSFDQSVGRFPRITSFVVLLGSVMIFTRTFLPASVKESLPDVSADSSSLGKMADDFVDEEDNEVNSDSYDQIRLGVLLVLYVFVSWLVGLIWTTPAFVALYLYFAEKPWYITVGLTVGSYLLAVMFGTVMRMDVQSGVLL